MKRIVVRFLSAIILVVIAIMIASCNNQSSKVDETTTAVTETPEEKLKREAAEGGFAYEKDGRVLVWHDEFDEDKINSDNWNFRRTMNGTDRLYDNSEKHARIEDGNMLMQLHKCDEEGKPYSLSEGFTTSDTMNFTYGRIEMRAKIPFLHGAWPSFWMGTDTPFAKATYTAEIDIFEVFGSADSLESAIHKWGENGRHSSSTKAVEGSSKFVFENAENLNNEYHIYALEWDKDYLSFYVDDVKYCSFKITLNDMKCDFDRFLQPGMQGFHDPAFIMMNNEFFSPGGSWCPEDKAIGDDAEVPINYYIDWVRLYQNPETDVLYLKDDIAAMRASQTTDATDTTVADTQSVTTAE